MKIIVLRLMMSRRVTSGKSPQRNRWSTVFSIGASFVRSRVCCLAIAARI